MTATRDPVAFTHTSVVLQQLHDEVQSDHVTLGWLTGRLRKRSYGMLMLVLALIATVPGVCMLAAPLLMISALQMIAGRPAPLFPRRMADHPLPLRHFAALLQRAVPVLKSLEKMTHPRWHAVLEVTKRLMGIIVVMLSGAVMLAPLPLLNVVPALVIALISLAYLEEDGLVLLIGLLGAILLLSVAGVVVWETLRGVKWVGGL